MKPALVIRRIVSIALLVTGILSFISWFILFLYGTNVLYKMIIGIPAITVRKLHILSSFTASGLAVIHIISKLESTEELF